MRHWKLILALVLAVAGTAVQAQTTWRNAILRNAATVSSATPCSTSQTTNAWDNFIEGFQTATTGYESNVWTKVGTAANITVPADSTSLTTYKPAGACSQAVKVIAPTDGTETYLQGDLGAAIDLDTIQTDIYFSFYVETKPDSSEAFGIFAYGSATPASLSYAVAILNSSGQLQVRPTGTGQAYININSGQWYTAKLSLDTAAAADGSSLTIYSNGAVVGSDTYQRNAGDLRYLYLGAPTSLEANDSGTVWLDLVCVKTN